jgi:hypothetical protein
VSSVWRRSGIGALQRERRLGLGSSVKKPGVYVGKSCSCSTSVGRRKRRGRRGTNGAEELALAGEGDVDGTVAQLGTIFEADDVASGDARRAFEVGLVESTPVGAVSRNEGRQVKL